MARQRPPDQLPRTVLERQEFIAACAERDLGKVLALATKWGGPGFTASHIGRLCSLGVSRIGEYKAGKRQALSIDVWERVADGLRIPGNLLSMAPRPWESEHDSVDRRSFLDLGGRAATSALVGTAPLQTPESLGSGSTSTLEVQREIHRLRRLDDTIGGVDLYRLYQPVVDRLQGTLKDCSTVGRARNNLLKLFSEHLQQTGWAAFDAGYQDIVKRLYEASFDTARECGDTELAANALAFRAYQLVSIGQDGTGVTARSIALAERNARPAVQALLNQRAAWTYAVVGNAEMTSTHLDQAARALDRHNGDAPDWATWACSELEQNVMAGRCWSILRRPLRSVPSLESAISSYSDHRSRDKALYLTSLAHSYIDAGEPERAEATARQAQELSEAVASVRPREKIASVFGRLADVSRD